MNNLTAEEIEIHCGGPRLLTHQCMQDRVLASPKGISMIEKRGNPINKAHTLAIDDNTGSHGAETVVAKALWW